MDKPVAVRDGDPYTISVKVSQMQENTNMISNVRPATTLAKLSRYPALRVRLPLHMI